MARRTAVITVTLSCPVCGPVTVRADEVAVECRAGVAHAVAFTCPGCATSRSVPTAAAGLALLHRAGVGPVEATGAAVPAYPAVVGPERQVVSLRLLLDDPRFLDRLVAPSDERPPGPSPAAAGAEAGAPDTGMVDG